MGNPQPPVTPAPGDAIPCVYVYVHVYVCTIEEDRGHQTGWRYEFWVIMSCLPWVLGTELRFSVITVCALNLWAISPAFSVRNGKLIIWNSVLLSVTACFNWCIATMLQLVLCSHTYNIVEWNIKIRKRMGRNNQRRYSDPHPPPTEWWNEGMKEGRKEGR